MRDLNMYRPKSISLLACFTALLAFQSSTVFAEDARRYRADTARSVTYPSYYPSGFQRKGVINKVNRGSSQLIVDGLQYSYPISLKVHNLAKESGSTLDLRKGVTIGFSFDKDSKGRHTITEIWEIPAKDHQGS